MFFFAQYRCTFVHMREYDFYVYILRCSDDSLYVGVTNHLERRLAEHQSGCHRTSYAAQRLPVTLVHVEHFTYVWDALRREKQLKRWTKVKKEALITGNVDALCFLTKRLSVQRKALRGPAMSS
jgi:putative endonuclease